MTTDAEDKAQSKFPRASLRARNKTLMITPADVGDFQVTSKRKMGRNSDFANGFDDPLSALDDASVDTGGAAIEATDVSVALGGTTLERAGQFTSSHSTGSSLDDGLEGLAEVLGSNTGERGAAMQHEEPLVSTAPASAGTESELAGLDGFEDDSGLLDAEDIFAAPDGISVSTDELFSGPQVAPLGDPIIRATRPVQSVLGAYGASTLSSSAPSNIEYDNSQDSRVKGGAGSGVVRDVTHAERGSSGEPAPDEAREYVDWKKAGKLVGFLVSYVSDPMGRYVELREGRLLVTSGESSSDSCLVIFDESVSPMHAIMRISSDGAILILDQLSEHGTRIRRADGDKIESLMGDKSALNHGDVVIFGECEYHVVVMGAAALKRTGSQNE